MPYLKTRRGLGRPMLVEPQPLYAGLGRPMLVKPQSLYQGYGGFGAWSEWSTTTKLALTGVGGVVVGGIIGYLVGRRRG